MKNNFPIQNRDLRKLSSSLECGNDSLTSSIPRAVKLCSWIAWGRAALSLLIASPLFGAEDAIEQRLEEAARRLAHRARGAGASFYPEHEWQQAGSFNEEIDRFFEQLNTPPPLLPPLEIQFLGRRSADAAPFLAGDPAAVRLSSFSDDNLPIDYIGGGLEAAKNERLENSLRSAASGAVYRFLIGLESTSPLLASAVKQIQTWANQFNAMNIHSYEMSAQLVPGMWPKEQAAAQYACEHSLIANGDAKNWIEAKYQCQNKQVRKSALASMAAQNLTILTGPLNTAKRIFSLMDVAPDNQDLLLNITGSICADGSGRIVSYPPLHRKIVALLQTGQAIKPGYRMAGNTLVRQEPLELKSLGRIPEKTRILALLKTMQTKLRSDSAWSEEENSLLGSSRFPIGAIVTLMTQYKGSGADLILERYSELLAFERVVQFVEEAAKSVLYRAESLRPAQIAGGELEQYIKQVREVCLDLQNLKEENERAIANEKQALDSLLEIDLTLRNQTRAG